MLWLLTYRFSLSPLIIIDGDFLWFFFLFGSTLMGSYFIGSATRIKKRSLPHLFPDLFIRVGKGGEGGGGSLDPWNFWFGARSPIISLTVALILLTQRSLEPKDSFCGVRSPVFWNSQNSIIRVTRSCYFLFTVNKRNEAQYSPSCAGVQVLTFVA